MVIGNTWLDQGYIIAPYISRYKTPKLITSEDMKSNKHSFPSITVDKTKLLTTLRVNRSAHLKAFEEATAGYRQAAVQAFEDRIAQIKDGKNVNLAINLVVPRDQTADYDRVIQMLEWDKEDVVELTEQQFSNYVQNIWDWTNTFNASTMHYTG